MKCHLWYSLTASLYCFVFSLVHCKYITSSIVFTAMDNSASLSKVGGHKFVHIQSHEIVFLVHRFGKTEASFGKQNKVVARKVTEACGLSLCTVH